MPAGHLHAGTHLSVEDSELLIGRQGVFGCGAAGDPGPLVVERCLANRLAGRVPHGSAVSVTGVGGWKANRHETRGGHATEPLPLDDLDVAARELSGDERERGYRRGKEIFPGFTHYCRWASNRQIPVLRLEPV